MISSSQLETDATAAENRVAEALNACGCDGVGYFRFSLPQTSGPPRKEPDFVLILRGGRILIVEVKGCRTEDISAIDGDVWTMAPDWPVPIERPRTQARSYALGLKEVLAGREIAAWIDWRVALPFVTAAEWGANQFPDQGGAVLFAEDLAPDRLRTFLAPRAASGGALPPMAEALGDIFGNSAAAMVREPGSTPTPAPSASGPTAGGSTVIRLTYSGRPPTDEELVRELNLGPPEGVLYLTATAALENLRKERFASNRQPMQFVPAIRAAMEATGHRWLSRVDQRVCLLRALEDPSSGDAELRQRLRHDASAWFDALIELDEMGRSTGDPLEPARYVDPSVVSLLQGLHDRALAEAVAAREGRLPFEAAAFRWLQEAFEPPPVVVLEGFTRLTPLQRAFVDRCRDVGTRLILVVPGSAEQRRGFTAVEAEHQWIAPRLDRHLATPMLAPAGTALEHVQRRLFADATPALHTPTKRNVTIRTFRTRTSEAEFALRYLRHLKAVIDLRWQVAVVANDPTLYEALLREEDSLQPEASRLFVPQPRNVLLTPVGRFIINLYAVGRDGPLDMTPGQFRELIASGWLGAQAAACAELFPSLVAQVLGRCRTEAEWRNGLAALTRFAGGARGGTVPPTQRRLPSNFVTPEDARALQSAFITLIELRRRLLAGSHGTVGEHASRLLSELDRLDVARLDADVREVMKQVRAALVEMETAGTMDLAAREFGEVLRGLGSPDETRDDEESFAERDGLRVVGLEQVDGAEYDVVIALGLDDTQMPGGSLDRWPRVQERSSEWIARQRYRFLAVARSARKRLVLLRPQIDADIPCRDSPFLVRVAKLVPSSKMSAPLHEPTSADTRTSPTRARQKRDRYSVEELSIASLCEHRWRLEAIEPRVRRFTNEWQLGWLARADWTAAVVQRLVASNRGAQPAATLPPLLHQTKSAVEPAVRERFGGLSDFEWQGISREVTVQLDWISGLNNGPSWIFRAPLASQKILEMGDGRRVIVHGRSQANGPSPNYQLFVAERDGAWIIGAGKDPSSPYHPLYQAVRRFEDWSNWVMYGKGPNNNPAETIERMEASDGARNPGAHCSYCPVRPRCLGMAP